MRNLLKVAATSFIMGTLLFWVAKQLLLAAISSVGLILLLLVWFVL